MALYWAWVGAAVAADPDWKLLLDDAFWAPDGHASSDVGDIVTARSALDGVPCGRAVLETDVSVASLLAVVTDVDHSERWADVARSERLPGGDPAHYDYVQVMDAPDWTMADDRFWVSRAVVETVGNATVMHWSRVPDDEHVDVRQEILNLFPKAIEIPAQLGYWAFVASATGTEVRYAACTDPGGSLPPSVQAFATRRSMPAHVAGLVKAAAAL